MRPDWWVFGGGNYGPLSLEDGTPVEMKDGAVGMVQMALDQLKSKGILEFDEERKATMVSNLLVVLCSERGTTPVVNAGSLNN